MKVIIRGLGSMRISGLLVLLLVSVWGLSSCTTGGNSGDDGEDLEASDSADPESAGDGETLGEEGEGSSEEMNALAEKKAPEPEQHPAQALAKAPNEGVVSLPQEKPEDTKEMTQTAPDLAMKDSLHMDEIRAAKAFQPHEKGVERGFSGAPVGAGLPEMGSTMFYVVIKGDTLGKIAQKILGDQKEWKSLKRSSHLKDANRIYPGDLVYYQLSTKTLQFAQNYSNIDKKELIVKSGDSLSKIAKRIYGNAKQWKSLWKQNTHIGNPNKIEVGTKIQYLSKATKVHASGALAKTFKTLDTGSKAATQTVASIGFHTASHHQVPLSL